MGLVFEIYTARHYQIVIENDQDSKIDFKFVKPKTGVIISEFFREIGVILEFSLNPLCELEPVKACYQITQNLLPLALFATPHHKKAVCHLQKRNEQREKREQRKSMS